MTIGANFHIFIIPGLEPKLFFLTLYHGNKVVEVQFCHQDQSLSVGQPSSIVVAINCKNITFFALVYQYTSHAHGCACFGPWRTPRLLQDNNLGWGDFVEFD